MTEHFRFLLLNLTAADINRTAASAFWWGLTSCLVLFWYLSLRNSCRYSDPSVWRGTFIDEVRLLTAMKQYLKRIKRHFPWRDLRGFELTQVLHLTTESWSVHSALLLVFRSAKSSLFCLLLNRAAGWRNSKRSGREVGFFFFFAVDEQKDIRRLRTCSGISVNLVKLSHTSNNAEFFSQTFTRPFTPSLKTCSDGNYT